MLSVVMPNFDHSPFLPVALDALIAQTRPPEEIIVIDDASTDESVSIIESYARRYSRIKFVRNRERVGVVVNVNRGLAMARGSLIAFAAADDVTYPGLFEKGISLLEANPQAGLFSARSDIIDIDGQRRPALPVPIPRTSAGFITPEEAAGLFMKDDGWFDGPTTIWRRDLLVDAGGFRPEFDSFADGYLSRLFALKYGACYSPEILAAWRRMEGGVAWSAAVDLEKMTQLCDAVEREMLKEKDVPRGYPARWKRRNLFGARRFFLVQARKRAKAAGLVPFFWASVCEMLSTAWLFVTLRPMDILTVLRRRLLVGLGGRRR